MMLLYIERLIYMWVVRSEAEYHQRTQTRSGHAPHERDQAVDCILLGLHTKIEE